MFMPRRGGLITMPKGSELMIMPRRAGLIFLTRKIPSITWVFSLILINKIKRHIRTSAIPIETYKELILHTFRIFRISDKFSSYGWLVTAN